MGSEPGDGAGVSLQDWLRILQTFTLEKFTTMRVDELFNELPGDPEDWYAHLQFCEDSYTRNLIGKDEHFELVALGWLGQQRTPIHDHAGQRCWMWVVHGSLKFQTYRHDENGLHAIGEPQIIEAGGKLYIDDELGWHSIENCSHKPAVSLHLYARPISACQVFDEHSMTFETRILETISVTPHGV